MNDYQWNSTELSSFFYARAVEVSIDQARAETIQKGRELKAAYTALAVKNPSMASKIEPISKDVIALSQMG